MNLSFCLQLPYDLMNEIFFDKHSHNVFPSVLEDLKGYNFLIFWVS